MLACRMQVNSPDIMEKASRRKESTVSGRSIEGEEGCSLPASHPVRTQVAIGLTLRYFKRPSCCMECSLPDFPNPKLLSATPQSCVLQQEILERCGLSSLLEHPEELEAMLL